MRIERIELNGFKSFADRTVVEMHGGITAIIGPNGCGKSNVVDALRWVLGEQSARNLRGGKMEEVIFNGTERKKQKGMAEVSIIMSGISRETPTGMPIDEVRVTRRLYRSGESEYMINNNPCRLRDIRDIFLDTGLELKSYAILEQGRVGDIMNSKPVDRRFLIEEAAGVVKYKVRKQEAVSKLESARNNLQRITDIVAEVKRQKNAIERQARKAERFKVLSEEARDLELGLSRAAFDRLGAEQADVRGRQEALRLQEAETASTLEGLEADIEKRRLEMTEAEQAIEAAQQAVYTVEKTITELEGRQELLRTERRNLEERSERNLQRDQEIRQRRERVSSEIAELAARREALETEVEEFRLRLEEGLDGVRHVEDEILDVEERIDGERRNLFSQTEQLANAANVLANINRDIESSRQQAEKARVAFGEAQRDRDEAAGRLAAMESERTGAEAEQDTLGARRAETEARLAAERTDRDEAKAQHDRARELQVAAETRLASLREMDENLSGYREGIRRLVKGQGTDHDLKIRALVADILRVPDRYETAVEALLGDRLQSLILESHGEARRALAILRDKSWGRGLFVPESPRAVPVGPAPPSGDGVIGRAADLVEADEPYGHAVKNLLADAVVVRDLDAAFGTWNGTATTLVTLNGEVLEPSGLLQGGAEKGLLSMKREIRDLETEVAGTKDRVRQIEASIAAHGERIVRLEGELGDVDGAIRELERGLQDMRHREAVAAEGLAQLGRRLALLENERAEADEAAERFGADLEQKTRDREALWARKTQTEEDIRNLQGELARKKRMLADLKEQATDRRVDYNARKTGLENLDEQDVRLKENLRESQAQRDRLLESRAQMQRGLEETAQQLEATAHRLSELVTRAAEDNEALRDRKSAFNDQVVELRGVEEKRRGLRPELDRIRGQLSELDIRDAQVNLELEHVIGRIRENYGQDLDRVEPTEVPEGAEERLEDLRRRMNAMGPVSLGSLEEHEELTERYEFLLKQQDDLNQSIASLEEAISKINRTTRERLRTAYEQLRENFQRVFRMLFGGGRADLELVGDVGILEAGIEIVAQPPGKRLQNISLLSGGEKALTAISLLFAGFLIKPSPLCVLDEVDAPLDESNTDKFANMLTEMARQTQFVTITHNRRTMEQADILYGVTMEEAGVTKIVSMKMTDYVEA